MTSLHIKAHAYIFAHLFGFINADKYIGFRIHAVKFGLH